MQEGNRMQSRGSGLLLVVVAVVIVAAAAFLFMARPGGSSGAAGGPGPSLKFSVTFTRSAGGMLASVTALNQGTEEVRDLKITRIFSSGISGGTTVPVDLGRIRPGASVVFSLPF